MATTNRWASIADASEKTGISQSILRKLTKTGELPAGEAWIYICGQPGGPIGWDVERIQQWQVEQMKRLMRKVKAKGEEIESYF